MLVAALGVVYLVMGPVAEPDRAALAIPPGGLTNGLIVYLAPDSGGQSQVFTIRPDGGDKTQLTQTAGGHFFPAWSQNGEKIAVTSGRTGAPELWVMNADGSNQAQLTGPPGSGNFVASWSPDGTRIVFASVRTGKPEIWVMNADGSSQVQLTATSTPGGSNAPSWSPDGTRIAFASDISGAVQIYTMNPDGSNVTQLTASIGPAFPDSNVAVWSPDGTRLAFWSGIEGQYGQIWMMDADGGNRQQLTTEPAGINSDNPAWSPDGSQILFETNRSGPPDTWIMDTDGGNQTSLFPFPYGAGRLPWQPLSTGVDSDSDGFLNEVEVACGSSAVLASSIPERVDGAFANIDDDGNNGADEPLPTGSDTFDCDGDGFPGTTETFIFERASNIDDQYACPETATANDEADDRWPTDTNDDQRTNTLDIPPYISTLNSFAPGPPYVVRLDLNLDNKINTLDVAKFVPILNKVCSP